MMYLCSRQKQVAEELRQARPPEVWDPALRAHLTGCRSCSDLVLVTQALQQDRMTIVHAAPVASPGIIWWKAQLRLRNGAVERVTRPIALAEKFALFGIVFVLAGLAVWQRTQIAAWFTGLANSAVESSPSGSGGWAMVLIIACAGTLILVGGLAVYMFTQEE